jgi:signal transduction histidine kinase
MFSNLWPEKMPSQWRLSLLMGLIVGSSIALTIFFVRAAVNQDLRRAGQAIILDDLVEYSAIYAHTGVSGVQDVFPVGQQAESNGMRILNAKGEILYEQIPEAIRNFPWPSQVPAELKKRGDTQQSEVTLEQSPFHLSLGAIRLHDGNTLWFGRSSIEAERYLSNIQNHLWLAGLMAGLVALLPVLWYSYDVINPIKAFTASAKRLHLPEGEVRLIAPTAIPELKTLASVINAGLDQILSLTRELQSTNDQLAHELRTPLARIRGNLEALHNHTDSPHAEDAAARSLEEIDRAAQLVQSILTIRAGDHGALRLYRQATPVNDLLEKVVDLFTPAAEDRGLKLSIVPGLDLMLNVDRELLTQAVANLLDNALAYTPKGGGIIVHWHGEGTGAVICVDDTGPGVHPEELHMIWERYNRGSAAISRHPGIGLGLSLVRAIATAHGGTVGVNNRDSGGASFWIRLPQGV